MSLSRFLNGMDEGALQIDEQRRNLLDAIRFFVGKITEEQLNPKVPSHEFVSAVSGLCFTLLNDHLPSELLAFAKHAGRKAVNDEDVLLYLRKTSLHNTLREYRNAIAETPTTPKGGRRKKRDLEPDDM